MKKKLNLKAIHDSDLDILLERLGILDLLETGRLQCSVCRKKTTRENFYCLYSEHGEIKICCNELQCYDKIVRQIKRR